MEAVGHRSRSASLPPCPPSYIPHDTLTPPRRRRPPPHSAHRRPRAANIGLFVLHLGALTHNIPTISRASANWAHPGSVFPLAAPWSCSCTTKRSTEHAARLQLTYTGEERGILSRPCAHVGSFGGLWRANLGVVEEVQADATGSPAVTDDAILTRYAARVLR